MRGETIGVVVKPIQKQVFKQVCLDAGYTMSEVLAACVAKVVRAKIDQPNINDFDLISILTSADGLCLVSKQDAQE